MAQHADRRSFIKAFAVGVGSGGLIAGTGLPSAHAATIPAQRSGASRGLTPAFFGLNGNNTQERLRWDRADLGAALAGLRPGSLRYPGGTIGNYWDWRAGWFQPGGPWPAQTNGQTGEVIAPFDNSLAVFRTALQGSGAQAVFMLNMLTIDGRLATAADNATMIQDQVEYLRAAVTAGIPVRRVELGNEFYLSGPLPGPNENDYSIRFPTATSYAQQANAWVTALRSAFPSVQIGAAGADATRNNSSRREGWNAGVLATLTGANALTLHPYIPITNASATPQSLLSMPHARVQSLKGSELPAIASRGLNAWITEFNMVDRTPNLAFAGRWTHGLFMAAYTTLLAQVPTVTLIDMHNVVGDAVAGALFDSTDGFRAPTPATQFLARTAMGTAFGVVLQAGRDATRGQALAFPGGPALAGGAAGVVGMEFTGGPQRHVVLVNLANAVVTVGLTGLFTGTFSWSRTSAPSLTTRVTGPGSLNVTNGTATGQLNLPRHSITRVFQ